MKDSIGRVLLFSRASVLFMGQMIAKVTRFKRCEFNVEISHEKTLKVKETKNQMLEGGRNDLPSSLSREPNVLHLKLLLPLVWTFAHFRSPGFIPHCGTFNAEALSQMLPWQMLIKCSDRWSVDGQSIQLVSILDIAGFPGVP